MKRIILALFSIVLISACLSPTGLFISKDPFKTTFAGQELAFRSNLIEASKVPVYTEAALKELLLNPDIEKVRIAYIPNDAENGFYAVSGYEVTYKLIVINKFYWQKTLYIEPYDINSTSEIVASKTEPVIVLLGPNTGATQTAVTVKDNVVIVEGKDFSEVYRKYTDLDLAVDKLLLVLMDIKL